jgi:hypothetical protein
MITLRGLVLSVNYGPLLRITLPSNMRHMEECLLVTSPDDLESQEVARSVPGVKLHVTDAMYRHGARMNKGLCFEECWDRFGREGWWIIWDADILLPNSIPLDWLRTDMLYGTRRRILADPSRWSPDLVWATCPIHHDGGPIGFTQIFDGGSKQIRDRRPWYDVSFAHSGGGDAAFMMLFPPNARQILAIDVLHLGLPDRNWYGVDQDGIDIMAKYVFDNGWIRAQKYHTKESADRAAEFEERVQVPGYEPSPFVMPFVFRTQQEKGRK